MSVILAVIIVAALTSCTGKKTEEIYVYNWGDYIADGILEQFTEETGIVVKYETFPSNEEMYNKIKAGGVNYDVVVPSDYMIEKMLKEGMLAEIDMKNVPNFAHVDDLFKNLNYDPDSKYSVAYMWGTVGILYNTSMVDEEITSWNVLWDEKYSKDIFMYDSVRDSIGLSLKRLGYSLNTTNPDEIAAAKDELIKQVPLVQAYLGDSIKQKLIANEGALGVVYSGDAMYAFEYNEDLAYVVPEEGSNYWYDGMVILKNAKNKSGAEKFIDFMCRPEIAAKNSEYIGYSTANKDALPLMDPEIVNNPVYWPPQEVLNNCQLYLDLGDFVTQYYEAWTEVLLH